MADSTVGQKKLTMNSIAVSIIKNSLYFLVIFGVMAAAIFPFFKIEAGIGWEMATLYSLSISGIATLIRANAYAKYYFDYQRYRSYIGQMLLFYKHKKIIYLEDVQKWIDAENQKMKDRFLRDASFHLGVQQEEDGTIDLTNFYPQPPVLPLKPRKNASKEKFELYGEEMTKYEEDLEKYNLAMKTFKVTWQQKRIIKKLEEKDYPKIPWKPSAVLNVIGDADFYVNRNVFQAEKSYKRTNTIITLAITVVILFFVGNIIATPRGGWTTAIQAFFGLFSIFSALIFGGIQGSNGGRKEERSLATANGIFKQIKPQEITEDEVASYIKENQIVVITDDNKVEPLNIREVAKLVVAEIDTEDDDDHKEEK